MRKLSANALLAAYFFALPFTVCASSVRINEIAWMGTAVSANHEWIELYNEGGTVLDLSGWTLMAEDGSPHIVLSGTIAPGDYFLLDRTSDETVPAVSADLVYPGALANSGETLVLSDAGGIILDTVAGGADWENIGGDNATKHTAQRIASSNSWVTATGTPKGTNVSDNTTHSVTTVSEGGSTESTASTQSGAPASTGGGASGTVAPVSVYPRKEISVFAGDDMHVFSGFPVSFSGSAKGLYDEPLEYATYRWNFGDGGAGQGKNVMHAYPFPGEYVVVLEAIWGPHKKTDRMIVAASQPDVDIPRAQSGTLGFIEIANHIDREIDLSRWALRVQSTEKTFLFPENTILLPRKSAIFPNTMTQLEDTSAITLLSPSGALVYQYGKLPPTHASSSGIVQGAATLKSTSPVSAPKQTDTTLPLPQEKIAEDLPLTATSAAATILWERGGGEPTQTRIFSENMKWFFALGGFLLIALAGFIIARSRNDEASIANEYAIIEDIIEGEIKE